MKILQLPLFVRLVLFTPFIVGPRPS